MLLKLDGEAFNLDCTLRCGQVFRWSKEGDTWTGVVAGRALRLKQAGNHLIVEAEPRGVDAEFIRRYFRLDDDLPLILDEIGKDAFILDAIHALPGLRLVRQEPWECLASYICSSYNNIPRIRSMVSRLCERFGEKIGCQGMHRFPSASALSKLTYAELGGCGLGFRARYLRDSAKAVVDHRIDLDGLRRTPYEEAKADLMRLPGVGHKVADCVCLFALDKLEAFPVDVWVRRIMVTAYSRHIPRHSSTLTTREYLEINAFGRGYFGRYAGYAQQYLYARHSAASKGMPTETHR